MNKKQKTQNEQKTVIVHTPQFLVYELLVCYVIYRYHSPKKLGFYLMVGSLFILFSFILGYCDGQQK